MKLFIFLLAITFIDTDLYGQKLGYNNDTAVKSSVSSWLQDYADSINELIIVNETEFTKDKRATYLKKSKLVNMGIYINPLKWGLRTSTISEESEFGFIYENKDIYAKIVTESSNVDMELLPALILISANNISPDVNLIKLEYRTVNELPVVFMEIEYIVANIRLTSFRYAYSNQSGTIQVDAVVASKRKAEYSGIIESFLNGITEIN